MNAPSLWTRIELRVDHDLIDVTLPKLSYVEACLQRSQSAGLDIEMHLGWQSKDDFIRDVAKSAIIAVGDKGEEEAVVSTLEEIDMHFSCSVYRKKEDAIFKALDSIISLERCNIHRWTTLALMLPSDYSQH
ncbi:SubName: Full=Uncharacterized protein {ECO:0000313/EMBL:CCA73500.1} [Serendipita indica DSM 11827]|nr:SubName: Full=Uncharacterized protein {ECO:0000313/EMBL:CCA73500.1} [Serendipita indica DSM 11827]